MESNAPKTTEVNFETIKELVERYKVIKGTEEIKKYNEEMTKKDSIHINTIQLTREHNNNLMERANGEFRDREKCTRGLKINDSPMITGYEIHHNFIKPHMGLNGKTPADMAGIEIQGVNKWKTIIENASVSL